MGWRGGEGIQKVNGRMKYAILEGQSSVCGHTINNYIVNGSRTV